MGRGVQSLEKVLSGSSDVKFLPEVGALITYSANPREKHLSKAGRNSHVSQGYNESLLSEYHTGQKPQFTLGYIPWGVDNYFPNNLMALNSRNPVSNGLLYTKRDFIAGKKIVLYRENIVNGEIVPEYISNPMVEDFLEEIEAHEKLMKWAFDFVSVGNYSVELIANRARNRFVNLEHHDPTLWRVGNVFNGKPTDYAFADWLHASYRDRFYVPAYDRNNPFAFSKCILHGKSYMPGAYYYGIPDWIGAENFIRLLNEIPVWHLSGIRNGFGIRWHIEVPATYFVDNYGKDKAAEAEQTFTDNVNKFLSGAENNGKAVLTKYVIDSMKKKYGGITIAPLKTEIHDKAFTELFNQGMMGIASAHGINPSLASVIMNGQLSSGSELRNAYNLYLQLKVPSFRRHILKPLYELKRANGWPRDLQFGIAGHQITKLDENSEGGTDVVT